MRLPDPRRSCAVLIGTGTYSSAEIPDLPAVANNLDGLAAIPTDSSLGGFSASRCTVLRDPTDTRTVYDALRQQAGLAEDTLLVYVAGHGMTAPIRNELYLALADTKPDALRVSALPFDVIREVLSESPAVNRIVILDCCFSGRATQEFMSGGDQGTFGQLDIEGTYILASAPATSVALAPTGARYTAFTGELIQLLRTGVPDGPPLLTFATIYRRLLHGMTVRRLPLPEQRGTGTVDQLALIRNAAISSADPSVGKDHGIGFEDSLYRILLDPILLLTNLVLAAACLFGIGGLLLLGETAPGELWFLAAAGGGTLLMNLIMLSKSRWRLRIDDAGITVRHEERLYIDASWNELAGVEVRRIPQLGRRLVVVPKLGSALLAARRSSKLWARFGCLPIYDLGRLDEASERAVRVALEHYSHGRYKRDPESPRMGQEE